MIKVIIVDDAHLHNKYDGVLLSIVAHDTKNHVYVIIFCVVEKENDAFWTFIFEKVKSIVVDESNLNFISDSHKSITNSIVRVYNHAHHRYYMKHFRKNFWINYQYGDYIYLYYHVAKAYFFEEFCDQFAEFKNY